MSKPHMTYILVGEITVEVMLNLFPYHCLGYHHSVDLLYYFYFFLKGEVDKIINIDIYRFRTDITV
jgi:hypothetical protein